VSVSENNPAVGAQYAAGAQDGDERYRAAHRVTVAGAVVNVLLAIGKIVVGWFGQSQALIADGVHSLSDLISDGIVLVGARHGSREADADHPYGHARIETAFTVAVGVILLLVSGGIAYDAAARLFSPEQLLNPGLLALVAAGISVLAKEALYQYTIAVARRIRSKLLRANAWHHRSDAVSSIVVLVGVLGTIAGLPYLDAIAAVAVALMVAKIGWELTWHSVRELVDTGLDPERVTAIRRAILDVDGVQELHMLRTRRMGEDALVDVHILVDSRLSVSEGHHISEQVRTRLVRQFDEVADVLVHIDPEDDEKMRPSSALPQRRDVIERIEPFWREDGLENYIERVTLHYLDGKLEVDVYVPLARVNGLDEAETLAERLRAPAAHLDEVADICVYYM